MAELTPNDVKCLGQAVGIDLPEPLLTEVTHNLNALKELLEEVEPDELSLVEPLPVIPPHERSWHEPG